MIFGIVLLRRCSRIKTSYFLYWRRATKYVFEVIQQPQKRMGICASGAQFVETKWQRESDSLDFHNLHNQRRRLPLNPERLQP